MKLEALITYKTLLHARDVRRAHTAWQPHTQTSSRNPVPYLVTRLAQLHIDDAILCIIDDVMIVLYWDTDCHLVHENSKG